MGIKGRGDFPISSAWCTVNNLRNQINNINSSNELKIIMSNYFFGTFALKVWDGVEWTADSNFKTYNGSSFVVKPIKVWDGNDWVVIQTN